MNVNTLKKNIFIWTKSSVDTAKQCFGQILTTFPGSCTIRAG